ncbi:hypothetical protein Tco_1129078 [Tanacetum coccineum]
MLLAESYRSLAWNVGLRLTKIQLSQESIKSDIALLKANIFDIKKMVSEMFHAFKATSSSTPSRSVVPIQSVNPTTSVTPKAQIIEISSKPSHTNSIIDITPPKDKPESSSFITPRVDKGKGIARDTDDSPPKLVKASRKVRPDHDAPILVEYEIDGKIVQVTHEEL